MITTKNGASAPFVFASTGDQLIVNGVISNVTAPTTETIVSAVAGVTVTNKGIVATLDATVASIDLQLGGTITNSASGYLFGKLLSGGSLSLTNDGTITGILAVTYHDGDAGSTVVNHGLFAYLPNPPVTVITLGGGNDAVVNSGTIVGDVVLGEGTNTYDGRGGTVVGTVFGGAGDDTYFLTQITNLSDSGGTDLINARMSYTLGVGFENLTLVGFGNFTGTGNSSGNLMTGNTSSNVLNGQGGDDTLIGGLGNDTLNGGTGVDSLDGGSGDDRLNTGYGSDFATGGDGNDRLIGDNGSDTLQGGNGNDTLDGGVGSDVLNGGVGNDVLIGGSFGSDRMTGGGGADSFVFLGVDDSLATHAADVITDFLAGTDKIDLSAVIDGDLLFVDSGDFSLSAASVRWFQTGGDTLVQVDLDHNGTADMQINLLGLMSLGADSFAL
ncbi:MAG: hypothetical protein ABI832_12890 [bacterium]